MNRNEVYTCPWCNCHEVVYGKQDGYSCIKPMKIHIPAGMKMQKIIHVICKQCGTIIRSYVEEPEKLDTDL